ncbi:MAG TPA: DEAD/DEAH box helicase, partial [Opitutaceae bacterium]
MRAQSPFLDPMIVGVHPLAGFDKVLHYNVPEGLAAEAHVGSLVRIPVGRAVVVGVIGRIGPPDDYPVDRLKSVLSVIYPFPALPPDLLKLASWMAAYYAAPMDAVIETMIPAAVRSGARVKQQGFIRVSGKLSRADLAELVRKAPAQAKLYSFVESQIRPQPKSLILSRTGASAASVRALVKRGLLREVMTRVERDAYADPEGHGELVASQPHKLNTEQAAAVAALTEALSTRKFGVSLLHGVTGSGKTEVYLRAIHSALETGGGVILLVPEVALTPQTVARLRSRLEAIAPGHRCVVWHSHLSEGERLDGWLALASGEVRVAVGARSA